ncbi:hypothetical protein CDAR_482321 [Caerostris darwini]|uniref:Uncharacterized protein n=1 Tax=Caerostris darwini TaxID=1538125 RepID=A0AAV4TKR1_9ARAC|nr:hypothetical protein CDAR_482321 [Caerostris darwini]
MDGNSAGGSGSIPVDGRSVTEPNYFRSKRNAIHIIDYHLASKFFMLFNWLPIITFCRHLPQSERSFNIGNISPSFVGMHSPGSILRLQVELCSNIHNIFAVLPISFIISLRRYQTFIIQPAPTPSPPHPSHFYARIITLGTGYKLKHLNS